MKNEKIMFQIDQLRKDKIIYAVESCAITLAMLLILLAFGSFIIPPYIFYLQIVVGIIGIGYVLYMGIGNFKRLKRVKELEKKLKY